MNDVRASSRWAFVTGSNTRPYLTRWLRDRILSGHQKDHALAGRGGVRIVAWASCTKPLQGFRPKVVEHGMPSCSRTNELNQMKAQLWLFQHRRKWQ